jgi:hypothetical protein
MAAVAEKARRRWFRLTPDRCVVALLALEGFLLLSAWFQWFAFNQHKGWTVLIAIASVGLVLLLMFLWFLAALVFRLRFQFSILALLALMLAVAVPFSWLATQMEQARGQREVVDRIAKARGSVSYDYERDPSGKPIPAAKPPGPEWLRKLLGDDYFADVTVVGVGPSQVCDPTQISDAGLVHLKGLTQLQWLSLDCTMVSDAGLEHLKGLTQLQTLWLNGTKVSDAGLEHLKGLTQLQWLDLGGTNVTDAGLEHLKGLTQLQGLVVAFTKVTDAGVKKLQQALPKCHIVR